MISAAHCMPIYLLGSLQYFADVRHASATPSVPTEEPSTTPEAKSPAEVHPSGVRAGEGEGR
jgi:hypothetical protein